MRPSVVSIFFLGFSAGLPFPLVYSTLSAWLEDAGLARSAISTFAWLGFAYSFKFLWAPLIDSVPVPVLTRLVGRRRAWLLVAQCGVVAGLVFLSGVDPATATRGFAIIALSVALFSATQDIVIDAFRIECDEVSMQGVLAAAYQYGYRVALLFSGAGALYIAQFGSWRLAYQSMALAMGVGVVATLASREPTGKVERDWAGFGQWLLTTVVGPFLDFFRRAGWVALPVLAYVLVFRLSDYVLGILANPFYLDVGFTKAQIASVAKVYGLIVSLVGTAVGAAAVIRLGVYRCLVVASILIASTNLFFLVLALSGPRLELLTMTISADNFAMGFAGTVFIAYLSSLTNTAFTATQYALFSSLSAILGKLVAGYSGNVQEWSGWGVALGGWVDTAAHDANWAGWVGFFVYAALLGVPSILLSVVVGMRRFRIAPVAAERPDG